MLKNIGSGNDLGPTVEQTYQAGLGMKASQGVLRGTSPGTVLTTAAMQQQTLATLNSAFDTVYAKAEGQPVQMADTNTAYTYKPTNRYVLNRSQVEIARKLGISPTEYAKLIEAHE
jgi:hypothetical protein